MPIFLIYLGYLIVRYKAFNLKMFGAQALVLALVALLMSEYAFVNSLTNRILVAVTLALTGLVGILLIRSVKREIEQREHIELLAKDLQKANAQQIILIHFITHQIKGFVTKSRNIFSTLIDGDYGKMPATAQPLLTEGLRSDTKGVETITEILNAANIKSGKVTYAKESFDLKGLVDEIVTDLKPAASAKKLTLELHEPAEPLLYTGDRGQLLNALKNLIDNSIKYTPSGSVAVSLAQEAGKVRFEIQDTGVGNYGRGYGAPFHRGRPRQGLPEGECREHGGFGLYIVKNIIEAHNGKVWAESEGAGEGQPLHR